MSRSWVILLLLAVPPSVRAPLRAPLRNLRRGREDLTTAGRRSLTSLRERVALARQIDGHGRAAAPGRVALQQDEQGLIVLLWAFGFMFIMAFLAIVVELGFSVDERSNLQNSADAAVLAGAQELFVSGSGPAITEAQELATTNHSELTTNSVTVSPDGTEISISLAADKDTIFAEGSDLRFENQSIGASATARIASPTLPGQGPVPWTISSSVFFDVPAQNGEEVTLVFTEPGTPGSPGNGLMDISLVLDNSGSIRNAGAVGDLKQFARDFVASFTYGQADGVKMGITRFRGSSKSVRRFRTSESSLISGINGMPSYGYDLWSGTDLVRGLQGGSDQFTNGVTDRDFAANVIVIVTDAEDTEADSIDEIIALRDAIIAAGEAGSPNGAIGIVAVGVGDQNTAILNALATHGAVFDAEDWDDLPALLEDIVGAVGAIGATPENVTYSTIVDVPDTQDGLEFGSAFEDATVRAASTNEVPLIMAGLRQRLQAAISQGCYTEAQILPPGGTAWDCGPLQVAESRSDGLQASSVLLMPVVVNSLEGVSGGETLQLFEGDSGVYTFAYFWVDAERTFVAPGLGDWACEDSPDDDLFCQIHGHFIFNTPPILVSSGDVPSGATIVDYDPAAPVTIVQLVN